MKGTTSFPSLGQSICWTAIFYACFGLFLGVLAWFISTASQNILLRMLGLNIPGWAAGWVFLMVMVPLFGGIGAISGIIIYWPMKALIQYLRPSRNVVS